MLERDIVQARMDIGQTRMGGVSVRTDTHGRRVCPSVRHTLLLTNKKLSCRGETARRFGSLNILLSHSRSLKVDRNNTVE